MAVKTKRNILGPAIREMRMKRKWTQDYLARKMRSLGWYMTRDMLAKIECTSQQITDCDLMFIAVALNVSPRSFFQADALTKTLKGKTPFQQQHSRHASPYGVVEFSRS